MTYDFSHLYNTETVNIGMIGNEIFSVTIREIPHGQHIELQNEIVGSVPLDTKRAKKKVATATYDAALFSDKRNLLAIESWTLKDTNGDSADVCLDAWRSLPERITHEIEKAVSKLNPSLEEEFQAESRDDGES